MRGIEIATVVVLLVALGCGNKDTQPSPQDVLEPPLDVLAPSDNGTVGPEDVTDSEDTAISPDVAPIEDTSIDLETVDTSPEPEPEPISLIDNYAWMLTPGGETDPWYGDGKKADDELCEPETYHAEATDVGVWFDVETDFCGYLTVSQPLLADVPVGALLKIHIYHEQITEGDDGAWTLAAAMGEPAKIVWSEQEEVPANNADIIGEWTASSAYSAGDPVYFHVSNHGSNVWSLLTLTAVLPVND